MIRFLFLEGKSRSEIKERLDAVYGESSPSMATVKNWFNEFKRGRTSVFDEPRPGAPQTATTADNVAKIHDLVLADRRLKVREIAETVGISKDRVGHILHEILGMRKLSARWVPRLLTPDNKRIRETTSEQCLKLFKRNPKEFLRRFVTVDETWIHWYTPETKEQSKQWTAPGEPAPKKAKTVASAGKVMATIFWDSRGVIFVDYLKKGKVVIGPLTTPNCKKRPHLVKKKVLLHHDNAPAHTCAVATAKLVELGYEVVPHPAYSPDLAPSDFFLFPNLKKSLAGQIFELNEVIAATEAYFAAQEKTYFSDGIKKLEDRWVKCIELKGDYVEK